MIKLLLNIAFVFFTIFSWSQEMQEDLSKKEFLIGKQVTLKYRIKTDKGDLVKFIPKSELIPVRTSGNGSLSKDGIELEILEEFRDTTIIKGSMQEWVGQYTVTAWDSGEFVIPGPGILINDSMHFFNDIAFRSDFTKRLDKVDIYDIKEGYADIPEEPFSTIKFLKRNWWWLLALILIPVFYFLPKWLKKKNEPVQITKAMSLKERTLLAIDALEREKLWEKDKLKEHFVELSYILRSYLTTRYDISILEKTTYETKMLLTQKGLNEDTIENIGRILSESDMVKFAKSKPEIIEILRVSTLAKQIVAETSPLDFDNYE